MAEVSQERTSAYRQMDEREAMIVQRAIREFAELQSQRAIFAGQWEEAAQIVLPTSRNTFYPGSFNWQGQKKTDRQIDMTAGLALHRFCAIADSLVTPRNMQWHGLEAEGPDADYVMKDRATRLWFEQVTKALFRYRYSQIGNFVGQNYNNWQSLGAFGNFTMFVDKFDSRLMPGTRGLRYKSVPLGETFFGENHQGMVDRIHRYFRLTPYQCVQKFGEEWTPPQLIEAYKKDSQAVYDFLHVVRPREENDYDPDRLDERGKPFESYYISMTGQCMVAPEGGYRKFPYAPSRYDQTPGEVYGRGWVQIALPAIKTLNAQKVVFLKQGHRAADPVLLSTDDGSQSFSLRPGAMNPGGMSPDGKALIGVLPTGKIDIAKEMMEVEAKLIRDTSGISLIDTLVDNPNMKATQVIQLVNERAMLTAPTLGRQHVEYVPGMVEREVDLLLEQRLLPPPPPRLREGWSGEYRVTDTSPLALEARAGRAAGFFRTLEQFKEVVQITGDPGPLDNFDIDTAAPEIAYDQLVPTRWMATDDKKAAIRKDRAKAQQAHMQIEAAPGQAALMNAQSKQAKVGQQQQVPA